MIKPLAFLAVPVMLALSACGDDREATGDDSREASNEVLEGTISDAMLPLDELQSQAPLAAPEPGEVGEGAPRAADANDAETGGVAVETPTEPEPVAEPQLPE